MYDNVKLVNLEQRTDLNGECGTTVAYDDGTKRYAVELKRGGKTVCVKPANMRFLDKMQDAGNKYLDGTMDHVLVNTVGIMVENGYKQANKYDFHVWTLDSNGNTVDPFADKLPHIKLKYKPWKKLSTTYEEMLQDRLQQYREHFTDRPREDLEKLHKNVSKMFDKCLEAAIQSHLLHGFEIKFGSCGFVMDSGSVYQEWGNFRDEPDY